jgi:[acyl-carrier-protein] S-malonyltransferase
MGNFDQTAFIFPGQGSQVSGMGADVAQAYPAARDIFRQADDLLGFPLSALCWEGPAEALDDTYNTQPALYVTSLAILKAVESELGLVKPAFVAGHSLGELTALAAAEAMSFSDGLTLVRERGRLMKLAGEQNPGAMAAVLGLEADAIKGICDRATAETGKPLVVANDNCPGQIVISGDVEAIEHGMALATESGARRVVRLAVSIASHSPLMGPIADEFRAALDATEFQLPSVPVIGNVIASPINDVEAIRTELGAQLTSSVRWTESMQYLLGSGVKRFVEIGSGDVLSGLMRRIDRGSERLTLNSAQAIAAFVQTAGVDQE